MEESNHQKQWEFLKQKFDDGNIGHAYIIAGQEGTLELAKKVAKYSADKKACQTCASCLAIEKEQFPDLKVIRKKEDKQEIEIAQIKDIQNFLAYKSYYGGYRVVIVDQAELMNPEAQNCFLKTLEEPKGDTILFLVTAKPDLLLETIRSRCQTIKCFPGAKELEEQQSWIAALVGQGLAEKFKFAKEVDTKGEDVLNIIQAMERYFRHLLLVHIGAETMDAKDIKAQYSLPQLQQILKTIDSIEQKLLFTNANSRLALEIVLLEL